MEKRYWIDDDYLTSKWKEMDSQIRQITAIRFGNPQTAIPNNYQRSFGDLVEDDSVWFSESGRMIIDRMQDCVGWLLKTLRVVVQEGIRTRQSYQDIKAKLTMVLGPSPFELDSERLARAAGELEMQLSPFTSPEVESEFYTPFTELLEAAVSLDAELAQCRALYQISTYPAESQVKFGFVFGKASMTEIFDHDGWKVALVVAPILLKIGHSKGEKYHQGRLLAPSRVISFDKSLKSEF